MDVSLLTVPVPLQADALLRKKGYRAYPLQTMLGRSDDPLVDIATYGIAGQSYYSRPNGATKTAIPGLPKTIYVRRGIALKLAAINKALQNSPEVEKLFGKPVELYVEEGLRARTTQQELYEIVFPGLIRAQFPKLTEVEVLERRDQLIAKPSTAKTPAPHATGAAIDVALRYRQPILDFVLDVNVPMTEESSTGPEVSPDYFEIHLPKTVEQKMLQRNRRAFYWIMRGALLDEESGFEVNPTEWWHWSYGDQMWAALTKAPHAFYGFAKRPR